MEGCEQKQQTDKDARMEDSNSNKESKQNLERLLGSVELSFLFKINE